VDALAIDSEGAPLLLKNEAPTANYVSLKLRGVKSNRNGYGARVTVEAGGRKQLLICHADGSYLASSDPRVHAGLGKAGAVDKVTIQWPSGQVDTHANLPANRTLIVTEGKKQPG
jgi:hypothetical protein